MNFGKKAVDSYISIIAIQEVTVQMNKQTPFDF